MKFIDFANDPWHRVEGDDAPVVTLTPRAFSLLDVPHWRTMRGHWPADLPVGVIVANDFDIEDLAADMPRIALVVLQFPKWIDGRAYSQAHTLRSRLRYAGEVRAVGDVLVDMLPLLKRTGFDAVALRADQSRDAAERALGFFPGYYQGDVLGTQPIFAKDTA